MFSNDDIVEKNFSVSKYLTSVEGILKLIAIVLIALATVLFLLFSTCPGPVWYEWLFPICTGCCGLICAVFYIVYVSGLAKRNFRLWNKFDIILTMICFVLLTVVAIVTLVNCTDPVNPREYVYPPLALIGAISIAISASVSLIKYRVDKDPVLEENNDEIPQNVHGISAAQYRKSVII